MAMDTTRTLPGAFQAVVLDLDGLLVDTEPIWLRAKHTMYARYGTTYEPADHRTLYGSSDAFSATWFAGRFGLTTADEEAIRLEYLELVAELLGEGVPTRPGARELLTSLRGRVPARTGDQHQAIARRHHPRPQRAGRLVRCRDHRR